MRKAMMPGKITRIAKRIQLKTIRVILSSPKKGSTDQRADLTGLNRLNVVTYTADKKDNYTEAAAIWQNSNQKASIFILMTAVHGSLQ